MLKFKDKFSLTGLLSFEDFIRTISVKKIIKFFYIAIFFLLSYILGSSTADMIGVYYFQPQLSQSKFITPKSLNKDRSIALNSFESVIDANIFNTDVVEKTTESGEPIADKNSIASQYELKGTMVWSAKNQIAYILDKSSSVIELFKIDDEVFESKYKLKEAGEGYAVLYNQSVVVKLELPESPTDFESLSDLSSTEETESDKDQKIIKKSATKKKAPAKKTNLSKKKEDSTPSVNKVKVVDGRADVVMQSDEIESALTDFSTLLRQARVVPKNDDDGKLAGYIIKNIVKGSFYETLGLQNGDLIKSVNNETIDSPEKAVTLFKLLRNEKQLNLVIERDAQRIDFNYFIQ